MEKLWLHTFYIELCVEPSEHLVLFTEAPLSPTATWERVTQIMFGTLSVLAVYMAIQADLSLNASGRTTGIVADSGDGVSHLVPILRGMPCPMPSRTWIRGSRLVTTHVMNLLRECCYSLTMTAEREMVRDFKEKLSYATQR